jgi:hypothetical protein
MPRADDPLRRTGPHARFQGIRGALQRREQLPGRWKPATHCSATRRRRGRTSGTTRRSAELLLPTVGMNAVVRGSRIVARVSAHHAYAADGQATGSTHGLFSLHGFRGGLLFFSVDCTKGSRSVRAHRLVYGEWASVEPARGLPQLQRSARRCEPPR